MSAIYIFLMLILVQHHPPPPPPTGFDLQSAIVQENFDGSNGNNEFVSNRTFRRAVRNNPPGSSFNGYNGFEEIWDAVKNGRITNLTRNNWRVLIDYTRDTMQDEDRTSVCEAAKAEGQEFNGNRCRDFYLPLTQNLFYLLVLSLCFMFLKRVPQSKKYFKSKSILKKFK